MEINISPAEIDKYVKQAILESSIGKILDEHSKKFFDELCSRSYDSPIRHMIHNIVREMLKDFLNLPENKAIIKEAFLSKFSPELAKDIIYKMMDKIDMHAENIR